MKTINLKVNTDGNRYSILIGTNLIQKFDMILQENSIKFNKCLLVIDKNIPQKQILILKKVLNKKKIFFVTINANEKKKKQKNNNKKNINTEEKKKPISAWVLFKKIEITSGNLDLNNIKKKYMQLSSIEIDEIKKKYSDGIISEKNNENKNNENKNNSNSVWNIYKELQFEQGITDMGLIKEKYNNLTNDEIQRYKKMNE